MPLSTEILVIGGGATGLGVAWDAALRGYKTLLVEKGDLAHGTSGRYHGLLHSGGRYVVRDPRSALDCRRENEILRRIMPSAIEDTGGFFAAVAGDPPDYVSPFLAGCQAAGILVEEVTPAAARTAEPLLTTRLERVFRVPDAACDSFDAAHAVAHAVQAAGGELLLRRRLVQLLVEHGRLAGAELEDVRTGERERVIADLVINCTGAWAGQVAALAGCEVRVTPGKGTMLAMNMRLVNTVVNRLKPPGDGDILVPIGTVSVIGTTETVVPSADQYAIEPWEVELLLAEGEKLLPRLREFRALRAWAGVRPLFEDNPPPPAAAVPGALPDPAAVAEYDSRLMTRAHSVLDHAARDGVEGFISVVGGKFTTFRLMAEEAIDLAGKKLNTSRSCRTAETSIDPPSIPFHTLGQRLAAVEQTPNPEIICECELVTRGQIEQAFEKSGSLILNDLRRDLRLGMGPCQAGFCAYRAAGIFWQRSQTSHATGESVELPGQPVEAVNSALMEFLQERWKGLVPIMWGANLQQLELDQDMIRGVLGVDRLPLARPPEEYPTEKTA